MNSTALTLNDLESDSLFDTLLEHLKFSEVVAEWSRCRQKLTQWEDAHLLVDNTYNRLFQEVATRLPAGRIQEELQAAIRVRARQMKLARKQPPSHPAHRLSRFARNTAEEPAIVESPCG